MIIQVHVAWTNLFTYNWYESHFTWTLRIERHRIAYRLKLKFLFKGYKNDRWVLETGRIIVSVWLETLRPLTGKKERGLVFRTDTIPLTTGTQFPHKPLSNQITKNPNQTRAPTPKLSSLIRKLLARVRNLPSWP